MTSAFQENAFQDTGFQENGSGPSGLLAKWRFLKAHVIANELIEVGEVRSITTDWPPTADVEPLDIVAATVFYLAGPTLGGTIRTQFQPTFMNPPVTFWQQIATNLWTLTGLGVGMAPKSAVIDRIDDKW